MRYKLFGNSGLRVSELCLGAMTFGEEWGWGASKDESRRLFEAFVAAGGNFIDTANHYTNGTSESYVGEFIAAERERFVLATKYTLNGRPDDPNGGGNHRKSMMQAINASLKRLGTDYIDLYLSLIHILAVANFFISSAHAARAGADLNPILLAQANSTVLCQRWVNSWKLLRRISIQGQGCFDEIVNTYNGRIEQRNSATCNQKC